MIVIIGWVLWLAPLGVLALAYTLGARSGAAAFGGLAHYVLILIATGAAIWLCALVLAAVGGGIAPLQFLRASIPAQAVALSTQSSLASLPAMLKGVDALGIRRETADVVLPIAVTIFRVTSPAFNLGVALYIAAWAGIDLAPWQIGVGVGGGDAHHIGVRQPARIGELHRLDRADLPRDGRADRAARAARGDRNLPGPDAHARQCDDGHGAHRHH
jgi:proton glutamate symport protein